MKKLSFLVSRWFLALLALALLSLAIWFIGPYLAFNELKPLEGVGIRVLVIALLLCGVLLWLNGWSTAIVFGVLSCLAIWHGAPLLSIGQARPLASPAARVGLIAAVIVLFALFGLHWVWKRMRSDEQFLKKALRFDSKTVSPAAARIGQIEARMNVALARLKSMRTGARGLTRLFQGTRYLYELPWYITLGAPSSGKSRALLNSGLSFPEGNSTLRAGSAPGATQQVDWWLANEAVLIDTAGYYVRPGTSLHSLPDAAEDTRDQNTRNREPLTRGPNSSKSSVPVSDTDHHRLLDNDEWFGLLALLRRRRPRAPVNGALLTIRLDTLTSPDASARIAEAHALRERLADLRSTLGVRFPVYVMITQMDRLPGFLDYFASLTEETRAQIWGVTLPAGASPEHLALRTFCEEQLRALASRVASGVNTRLDDEYDMNCRRSLARLPEAFAAIIAPLCDVLGELFVDSRYDDTQQRAMLRGVYFTSAMQGGMDVVAEPLTVMRRITAEKLVDRTHEAGNQSYFLHTLFARVILREAHLVRPNLRWEYRFRALRLVGHALPLLLFGWLAVGLFTSFGNNSAYLDAITRKTHALSAKITQLYREPKAESVPDALTEARYLPTWTGLDLSAPDPGFRFGLYSAPAVVDASDATYRALENNLLLPHIVHRLEDALSQAITDKDAAASYNALRVYLMLYDREKFDAGEVKAWVLDDWARTDSASVFGGRASMIDHVQQLFSGDRIVQSPLIRNDALIQRARALLDTSNGTQRLYERAKAAMTAESPDEFTLLRAVGPQAGTVVTRASGAPLSRGVAGLFSYDGYRNLFDKRLHEFVQRARNDDAWVMGRSYLEDWSNTDQKKTADFVKSAAGADDSLSEAIRRLYLTEYAQRWEAFLADIRPVTGTSLSFNLQILRQFAAPDSPLARLARAAVRETTLTRNPGANDSLLQKTSDQLAQKADKALGIRAEERIERELVDNRFAALREMVTGDASAQDGASTPGTPGNKTGLDGVSALLNENYTAMTVADNALTNNSLPPASDASAKLKMAANTMPAPFREVLLGLSSQGSREVAEGIGQLLSRQMQSVVGDVCRLAIEGNFPFSPDSKRDVSIDDFTRMFAQGGVIDDFFTKNLGPLVDVSGKPWRYKTLPGATEPVHGPDLEPFEHARDIRNVFFGEQGKQLSWKMELRVPDLDPTVLSLAIDIDGQSMLYEHGPVRPLFAAWPGPRGGVHAEITASPRIRQETSTIAVDGPWALMRLLRKGQVVPTATPGRTRVALEFDGRKAVLDIASPGSVANPLTSDLLTTFRCPSGMPIFALADSGPPPGLPSAATAPPTAAQTAR
ncbi:ImcF domain-containing protein [Caballeronia calidae]|uniref:ImcF domain-containing protein n=1 Tax=Caballeronia calidae TaxID=1777139 RepID=A0A158D1Q4_9BURK|nr:type VI secretion system membrane subunit TssM [Caballeronia calidae]SAK88518.1 ImcF domain-containing protein [Caballeronia calidae]